MSAKLLENARITKNNIEIAYIAYEMGATLEKIQNSPSRIYNKQFVFWFKYLEIKHVFLRHIEKNNLQDVSNIIKV